MEACRAEKEKDKKQTHSGEKGKGKGPEASNIEIYNMATEKLGMAIIHNKKHENAIKNIIQHDNRNITIVMQSAIGNMAITGTHAPHADAEEEDKRNF